MPLLHPESARIRHSVPLWIAVVIGVATMLATIGVGVVSTLLGGPIRVAIVFGVPGPVQPPIQVTTPVATGPRPTPSVVATPTTVTTSNGPTTVVTPSASPRVTGNVPPTYLKNLNPPTGNMYEIRPQTISGQRYEEAFKLWCQGESRAPDRTSWNVSGSSRFTAVIGISDAEEDALDIVARVSIQDERGANLIEPFEVALGRPRTVDIAITGIVQLQVLSSCRDAQTNSSDSSYITLGDAALR